MSVTSTRTSNNRDGSSALSTSVRSGYYERLGSRCSVCGYFGKLDVAHIIPRRKSSDRKVYVLRGWSVDLRAFSKDAYENFILLCPNHHQQFDDREIILLPSLAAIQAMTEYEDGDWDRRVQAVSQGKADPGRRIIPLEGLPVGLLYIPATIHYYVQVYNGGPALNQTFPFDSWGVFNRPEPNIRVSAYALLLAAQKPLNEFEHVYQEWSHGARRAALDLIAKYNRRMTNPTLAEQGVTNAMMDGVLAGWQAQWGIPVQGAGAMPTIPEHFPQGGGGAGHGAMDGVDGSTSSGTSDVSSGGISEEVQETGAGKVDDDNEPVVTPAVLKSRLRWHPVECHDPDVGSMRFATSSDFVAAPITTGTQDD